MLGLRSLWDGYGYGPILHRPRRTGRKSSRLLLQFGSRAEVVSDSRTTALQNSQAIMGLRMEFEFTASQWRTALQLVCDLPSDCPDTETLADITRSVALAKCDYTTSDVLADALRARGWICTPPE